MEPQDVYTQTECPECGCPDDDRAWHVMCDYHGPYIERTYIALDAIERYRDNQMYEDRTVLQRAIKALVPTPESDIGS